MLYIVLLRCRDLMDKLHLQSVADILLRITRHCRHCRCFRCRSRTPYSYRTWEYFIRSCVQAQYAITSGPRYLPQLCGMRNKTTDRSHSDVALRLGRCARD
jgi:hypothetical protein